MPKFHLFVPIFAFHAEHSLVSNITEVTKISKIGAEHAVPKFNWAEVRISPENDYGILKWLPE